MLKFPLTPFRNFVSFLRKLAPNLLMKRCQCIASRDPASLNVIRGSILFMQCGEAVGGWQLRSDAAHRRARGANYVCDNMRLESECRCPIQTSSSAATTGGINRATCNNRPRIIISVARASALHQSHPEEQERLPYCEIASFSEIFPFIAARELKTTYSLTQRID